MNDSKLFCVRRGAEMFQGERSIELEKDRKNKRQVAIIGGIFAIVVALIPMWPTYVNLKKQHATLEKEYERLQLEYDNLKLTAGIYDLDKENLLIEAEKLYQQGDYISALQVYKNERLASDPVALNNQAYIYLYYFDESYISDAKECLRRASSLDDQYETQFLAINILYPVSYDEIFQLLRIGISKEDIIAMRFCYACLENLNLNENMTLEDFCRLEYKEASYILQCATVENHYRFIQGKVPDYMQNGDFIEIVSTEVERIPVGIKTYDDTLHSDILYGNVRYVNVKRKNFICDYIVKNAISFIYQSESD